MANVNLPAPFQRKVPFLKSPLQWFGQTLKSAVYQTFNLRDWHTQSFFVSMQAGNWKPENYETLAHWGIRNPVVATALRLYRNTIAPIPVVAQYQVGDDLERDDKHPMLRVLKRPNARQSYMAFVGEMMNHLMFGGELFFYAPDSPLTGPNAGRPRPVLDGGQGLSLIRPPRIAQIVYEDERDPDSPVLMYRVRGRNGAVIPIPGPRVHHVRLFNPEHEDRGLPLLVAAWRQAQMMADGDDWNSSLMQNKGVIPGVFQFIGEGVMTDVQKKNTAAAIKEGWEQASKESKPTVLDGDYKWVPINTTPPDADWLEGDKANIRKLALSLGVDPALMGDQGSRTLANLEQALKHLMVLTTIPLMEWILDEWTARYMMQWPGDRELALDLDQVKALQEDMDAKYIRFGTAVRDTLITVNEARTALGWPAYEESDAADEADRLWILFNRVPLDRAGEATGGGMPPLPGEPANLDALGAMTDLQYKHFRDVQLPALLEDLLGRRNGG